MQPTSPSHLRIAVQALCDFIAKRAERSSAELRVMIGVKEPQAPGSQSVDLSAHETIALQAHVEKLDAALKNLPMFERLSLLLQFNQNATFEQDCEINMLAGSTHCDLSQAPEVLETIAQRLYAIQITCPDKGPVFTFEVRRRQYGETEAQFVHATSPRQAVMFFALMSEFDGSLREISQQVIGVSRICPKDTWVGTRAEWPPVG